MTLSIKGFDPSKPTVLSGDTMFFDILGEEFAIEGLSVHAFLDEKGTPVPKVTLKIDASGTITENRIPVVAETEIGATKGEYFVGIRVGTTIRATHKGLTVEE